MSSIIRMSVLTLLTSLACVSANAKTIKVNNAEKLQKALLAAQPGDEIVVSPGLYVGDLEKSGRKVAHFYIKNNGTKDKPITLRSESKKDKAILSGKDHERAYGLFIVADYWIIKDIKVRTAQKGIMLDKANYNVLDNVQVYNTGTEAVHFRKSSSHNVLKNCHIFRTGMAKGKEGFGEGVYVGTNAGHEPDVEDFSNYNVIGGCHFGPEVSAEAIDIKAGTVGTVVEHNYMDGSGIIGEAASPAADSFIDVKGDKAIIRNNYFDYGGSPNMKFGIMTYEEHQVSNIYKNAYNMADDAAFLKLLKPTAHVKSNKTANRASSFLEKDYQKKNMSRKINKDIQQPKRGPYSCFDEYAERCKKLAN